MAQSEFLVHVRELLTGPNGLNDLDVRRAFNGHGLYESGVLFAWVWDDEDVLQLKKVVERTRSGKQKRVAYSPVPEETLEDPHALIAVVRDALSDLP